MSIEAEIAVEIIAQGSPLSDRERAFVTRLSRQTWRDDLGLTRKQSGWLRSIHKRALEHMEDDDPLVEVEFAGWSHVF